MNSETNARKHPEDGTRGRNTDHQGRETTRRPRSWRFRCKPGHLDEFPPLGPSLAGAHSLGEGLCRQSPKPTCRLPARTHPTHVRVAPPQSLVMVRELGLSILGWPPWPQLTVGDHRTVHPPPQLAPAQLTLGVRLSSGPMASLPIRSRPHAAAAPGRAPPHGGDRSRPQRQAWPTCPAHSAPTAPTQRDANGCHLRYEG